jgi:hypothetical protein
MQDEGFNLPLNHWDILSIIFVVTPGFCFFSFENGLKPICIVYFLPNIIIYISKN